VKKLEDLKLKNRTFQSRKPVGRSNGHILATFFSKIFYTILTTLQYKSLWKPGI